MSDEIRYLAQLTAQGRLSRRSFLGRAGALGLSVAAANTLLSRAVQAAGPVKGGTLRVEEVTMPSDADVGDRTLGSLAIDGLAPWQDGDELAWFVPEDIVFDMNLVGRPGRFAFVLVVAHVRFHFTGHVAQMGSRSRVPAVGAGRFGHHHGLLHWLERVL